MIKFFRQIRQTIIMENSKTSRYLKYAIGEIILVVIGILIALQINNWNEDRKSHKEELLLYKRIVNDLKVDQENLRNLQGFLKKFHETQVQVYEESTGLARYNSKIDYSQLRWAIRFSPVVRENNTQAISTISNDEVRNHINRYFKQEANVIEAIGMSNKLRRGKLREFLFKNGIINSKVLYEAEGIQFEPLNNINFINYEKLKAQYGSIELDQILAELRLEMAWTNTKIQDLIEANTNLIMLLEEK